MIETSATLLSSETRPNEEFRCIFASYPHLGKDPPNRQCHELDELHIIGISLSCDI
jgi:hypothetical protein